MVGLVPEPLVTTAAPLSEPAKSLRPQRDPASKGELALTGAQPMGSMTISDAINLPFRPWRRRSAMATSS
jgi:hypothetical protein